MARANAATTSRKQAEGEILNRRMTQMGLNADVENTEIGKPRDRNSVDNMVCKG